jgi:hypothetical protein
MMGRENISPSVGSGGPVQWQPHLGHLILAAGSCHRALCWAIIACAKRGSAALGRQGDFVMSASMLLPSGAGGGTLRVRSVRAFGVFAAVIALLCTSLLMALETPSKPFLDKNSFYLSSAGFRVQVANDEAGRKALHALPPHRFVLHKLDGGDVRYLYAEPLYCVCIFIGTRANYQDYRDILSRPLSQPDDVSPDYSTQASALLYGDPYDLTSLDEPDSLAGYLRDYY